MVSRRLPEFDGTLGTPEHEEWIAQAAQLQKSYAAKRARWVKELGRPYPRRSAPIEKPHPGLVDDYSDEEG